MKKPVIIVAALLLALLVLTTPAAAKSDDTTVSLGSTGQRVTQVQYLLKSFGYAVPVSGKFEARTQKAVVHFQKVSGLAQDGVVGPVTWYVLNSAATANQPAVRVDPPRPVANAPSGEYVYGEGNCTTLNHYAQKWGLSFDSVPGAGASGAGGFDDQPRQEDGVSFAAQGIGFREGGCNNAVGNSCCGGAWGFNYSNLNASGYGPVIRAKCGVLNRSMIQGNSPSQWDASACVTSVLYEWYLQHGGPWPWRL